MTSSTGIRSVAATKACSSSTVAVIEYFNLGSGGSIRIPYPEATVERGEPNKKGSVTFKFRLPSGMGHEFPVEAAAVDGFDAFRRGGDASWLNRSRPARGTATSSLLCGGRRELYFGPDELANLDALLAAIAAAGMKQ